MKRISIKDTFKILKDDALEIDQAEFKKHHGNTVRFYVQEDQNWPIFMLSPEISSIDESEIWIGVSKKAGIGGWWEDAKLPRELIGDFIEMLEELK